jgi:hypothetical protein
MLDMSDDPAFVLNLANGKTIWRNAAAVGTYGAATLYGGVCK